MAWQVVFLAVDAIGIVVEAYASALGVAGLHVRDVEGGMAANLEVYLAHVGIQHVPDDADPVAVERVADAEGEVVRIDFLRLLG